MGGAEEGPLAAASSYGGPPSEGRGTGEGEGWWRECKPPGEAAWEGQADERKHVRRATRNRCMGDGRSGV